MLLQDQLWFWCWRKEPELYAAGNIVTDMPGNVKCRRGPYSDLYTTMKNSFYIGAGRRNHSTSGENRHDTPGNVKSQIVPYSDPYITTGLSWDIGVEETFDPGFLTLQALFKTQIIFFSFWYSGIYFSPFPVPVVYVQDLRGYSSQQEGKNHMTPNCISVDRKWGEISSVGTKKTSKSSNSSVFYP